MHLEPPLTCTHRNKPFLREATDRCLQDPGLGDKYSRQHWEEAVKSYLQHIGESKANLNDDSRAELLERSAVRERTSYVSHTLAFNMDDH